MSILKCARGYTVFPGSFGMPISKSFQFSNRWHQRAGSDVWGTLGSLASFQTQVLLGTSPMKQISTSVTECFTLSISLSKVGSVLGCPCGTDAPEPLPLPAHWACGAPEEEPRPPWARLTVPQGCAPTAHCAVVTKAQHRCAAALLLCLGNMVRGERLV